MSIQGVNRVDQKLNYPAANKVADTGAAVQKNEKPDESGKVSLTLACLGALGAAAVGYLVAKGRAGKIIESLRTKIEEAEKAAKKVVSDKGQKLNNKVADAKAATDGTIKVAEPKAAEFKAYGVIGGEKEKFVAEHTKSFNEDLESARVTINRLKEKEQLRLEDFEEIEKVMKIQSFNGFNIDAKNWVAGNLEVKEATVTLLARLNGLMQGDTKISSALTKAKRDLADYALYQLSGEGRAQTKEECQKAISIVAKYSLEAKKARPRFSLSGIVSSNANKHDIRVSESDMSKLESLDEIWC